MRAIATGGMRRRNGVWPAGNVADMFLPLKVGESEIARNDAFERLLNEIGRLLAEDTEYPLDGTLLYATLDRTFVAPALFNDRGNLNI